MKSKSNYTGGIAVYKLIGYCKTQKDADIFIQKQFEKTIKSKTDKYTIFRKERMNLWGTDYDKN